MENLYPNEGKKLSENIITHWLNIWHYEAEHDLLAAFLTSIHQAVYAKIRFNERLWWKMLWRQMVKSPFYRLLPMVLLITIGIPCILFMLTKVFLQIDNELIQNLAEPIKANSLYQHMDLLFSHVDFKKVLSGEKDFASFFGLIGSIIGALISAISVLPKNIRGGFKTIFKSEDMQTIEADAAANKREIFKKEFWNLMEMIGQDKRILVIFIDDIDRIDGSKIKTMMQSINFMTDVGSRPGNSLNMWSLKRKGYQQVHPNLYFVLGMWVDKVAKNLGRELLNEKEKANDEDDNEAYKEGRNYIEKIADLIITIPGFDKGDLGGQLKRDFKSAANSQTAYSPSANTNKKEENVQKQ